MRKALLSLVFIFTILVLNAQNLTLQFPQISKEGPLVSYEENFYTQVYNNTSNDMNLRWVRIENDLPQGWVSKICDDGLCYNENVSTADYNNVLKPGDSTYIVGYIVVDGVNAGDADVNILIYDINDSVNSNVTFNFQYTTWPTGIDKPEEQAFALYPVPAKNSLNFELPASGNKVEVYDLTGKLILQQDLQLNIKKGSLNLGAMESGSYIFVVRDENDVIINRRSFVKL